MAGLDEVSKAIGELQATMKSIAQDVHEMRQAQDKDRRDAHELLKQWELDRAIIFDNRDQISKARRMGFAVLLAAALAGGFGGASFKTILLKLVGTIQ